jgi:hypothetical protein
MNRQEFQSQFNQIQAKRSLVEGDKKTEEKKDLKDFYLKAHIPKDSIKTEINNDGGNVSLGIAFTIDAIVKGVVRINTCVTQQKNANNVPIMFYTPN